MAMKGAVFSLVTPCRLSLPSASVVLLFGWLYNAKDGGYVVLPDVKLSQNYTTLQPRKQCSFHLILHVIQLPGANPAWENGKSSDAHEIIRHTDRYYVHKSPQLISIVRQTKPAYTLIP
jgi:hypothetical protein